MEHQTAVDTIILFVGWGGLLLLSPFLFFFSRALTKYLIYKIWPVTTVRIEHEHDGKIVKTTIVRLDSSTPLAQQLANIDSSGVNGIS